MSLAFAVPGLRIVVEPARAVDSSESAASVVKNPLPIVDDGGAFFVPFDA